VALDAGCQGGHARKSLFFRVGMAGEAVNSLLLVFFVIEGDGLISDETQTEGNEKKKEEDSDRQSEEEEFHSVQSPGSY
jgi:hypothetical protein